MRYVKTNAAAERLGCHPATLRRWAAIGFIKSIVKPSGQRLYDVESYVGDNSSSPNITLSSAKEKAIYCRVSSSKQRADLNRQVERLSVKYPEHIVYKEIASGINFKRAQLYRLLERCLRGMVSEVVVAHRDRLCRIAWDHFSWLLEHLGVRLIVDSKDPAERSDSRELADDLMAIVHVFSCRHYGARRAKKQTVPSKNASQDIANKGEQAGETRQSTEERVL